MLIGNNLMVEDLILLKDYQQKKFQNQHKFNNKKI